MPWFRRVLKGRLETELLTLRLESGRYGSFLGQGFLNWDRGNGFEIRALTDGGKSLTNNWFCHEPPVGSLISPEWYLQLSAESRFGHVIEIDRLSCDGWDVHSNHDCVVWSIPNCHLRNVVDFRFGSPTDTADSIEILFSNRQSLTWPRRGVSSEGIIQGCLQTETVFGKVSAEERENGDVCVRVESDSPQNVKQLIDSLSAAMCFWAGKVLHIVAYETTLGDATRCRVYPFKDAPSAGRAPPLGYEDFPAFAEHHETLLKQAINFFAREGLEPIGTLLQTSLAALDLPFSVGVLVACSALEGIAKKVSKSAERPKAITKCQIESVEKFLNGQCFPEDLVDRFRGFMGSMNARSGANAIREWCDSNFLGFTLDDWNAWNYRNQTAHGNLSLYGQEFEGRKAAVIRRDRIRNMINKLVMHAIGYQGIYFDYVTYSEKELMS